MPSEECRIPVSDLAIQRGIGIFDSIRTYSRKAFAMDLHLERLLDSAERCGIEANGIIEKLPEIIREGIGHELAPKGDMIIKPYITGGSINSHGHFPSPDCFVLFEEIHAPAPEAFINGIALEPVYMQRPLPETKSTNYLTGYVPMRGTDSDVFEALYITNGEITEATSSSFFICKEGRIITAPVGKVLRGITREIVISLLEENNFTVEERCPLEYELAEADEAFISGSVKEILPVVKIGKQVIGKGHPGPVSKHIYKIFLSNIGRWME